MEQLEDLLRCNLVLVVTLVAKFLEDTSLDLFVGDERFLLLVFNFFKFDSLTCPLFTSDSTVLVSESVKFG